MSMDYVPPETGLMPEARIGKHNGGQRLTVQNAFVLIQASPWWGDEFSCYAINIMALPLWETARKVIEEAKEITLYIGTNEQEELTGQQYLSALEVAPISEHQADTVVWALGGDRSPGMNVGILDVMSHLIWDEDGNLVLEMTAPLQVFIEDTELEPPWQ